MPPYFLQRLQCFLVQAFLGNLPIEFVPSLLLPFFLLWETILLVGAVLENFLLEKLQITFSFWFHISNQHWACGPRQKQFSQPSPTTVLSNTIIHKTNPYNLIMVRIKPQACNFCNAVAWGHHLCMRLCHQNHKFPVPHWENYVTDCQKTTKWWQIICSHQQKWPRARSEDFPCRPRWPIPLLRHPQHAFYLWSLGGGGGGLLVLKKALDYNKKK